MRKQVEKPQLGIFIVGALAAGLLCTLFGLTRGGESDIRFSVQEPRSTREYSPDKQHVSNMMSAEVCVHDDGLMIPRPAPYQSSTGRYPGHLWIG